jgi:cell volume regulation protein A
MVGIAMLSFTGASLLHASGFLAVYLTGLWLGNSHLPHRHASIGFVEALAWLAQIGMFVLLGLLASPTRLPAAVIPALIIGTGLLLLARPLSVLVAATPFRIPLPDQAFLSWAGLRGAVPIVMATIPLAAHTVHGELIFDVVFVLVFVFTLIQGPTLPWVARRLGVIDKSEARDVDVEVAPLDMMGADLLSVTVPEHSRLHGMYVLDLRLPEGAVVSLVTRGEETMVPAKHTRLVVGDTLLVVTADGVRDETERRLRAVGRAGQLARWFGESGR